MDRISRIERADTRVCPYGTSSNGRGTKKIGTDTSPPLAGKRNEVRAEMCLDPFSNDAPVR